MSLNTVNIFISHSWSYTDAYDKLIRMLNKHPYFEYKNYSVPKDDPLHTKGNDKELEAAIENQVSKTSVVLILAGVYSSYSKWINKEVKIAKKLGKKIIAVEPFGAERTSLFVKTNADYIVKWNTDSIIKAIRA